MSEAAPHSPEQPPRMTDALQEALQTFRMEHGTSSVEQAHVDALKEYRKRDREGYSTHIADLAVQEADDELESGHTYRNLLRKEDLLTSSEEKWDATKTKTMELGNAALYHSKVLAVGFAKAGWDKIDGKIFELQAKHSEKKHMKQLHAEALAENKQFDKQNRREARRARRQELREEFVDHHIERARKIGRFVMDMHQTGLDVLDPVKAAEFRQKRLERQDAQEHARFENAFHDIDMSQQMDIVRELSDIQQVRPSRVIEFESGETGFMSSTLVNEQENGTEYALFYGRSGDQLVPQLLKRVKDGEWNFDKQADLMKDIHEVSDEEIIERSAKLLGTTRSDLKKVVDGSTIDLIRQVMVKDKAKTAEIKSPARVRYERHLAAKERAKQAHQQARRPQTGTPGSKSSQTLHAQQKHDGTFVVTDFPGQRAA